MLLKTHIVLRFFSWVMVYLLITSVSNKLHAQTAEPIQKNTISTSTLPTKKTIKHPKKVNKAFKPSETISEDTAIDFPVDI